MTTIGLVSDTHSWLDPDLLEVFSACEMILHAGDIGDEDVLTQLQSVAKTVAVRGNIDGGPLRYLPLVQTVTVHGRKISVLHIAGSPKRPRKEARALIKEEQPDVLVVGHSHIPVVGRVQGTLWINPGAAGKQGFHDQRFAALLHVSEEGELSLDRVHLGPRSQATLM